MFARKRIDRASYLAGREFQRLYHLADRRRPDEPDALAEDQRAAWEILTKVYKQLGKDGSALINDVLIDAKTTKQIAEPRGKAGPDWERFYSRRLWECLRLSGRGLRVYQRAKEDSRFWQQNTNHWRAITRPG